MLTWDTRALRGKEDIKHMLTERLAKTGIRNLRVIEDGKPHLESAGEDLAFVTSHFAFDFAHGTGSGMFRLAATNCKTGSAEELADVNSWKALHISTTVDSILGQDLDDAEALRDKRSKLVDPLGKKRTYRQQREDAREFLYDDEGPTVLLVGAGHSSLMMVRLLALASPPLIPNRPHA
jgi:hypothetical protein